MKITNNDQQLQRYLTYLEADPHNLKLLMDISNLYIELGKGIESLAVLERALALYPNRPEIRVQLFQLANSLYMQKEWDIARAIVERHLLSIPDLKKESELLLARILHASGEIPQAIEHLEHLQQEWGDNDRVLALLGICFLDTHKADAARTIAERALLLNPDNLDAQLVVATLSLQNENTSQSLNRFKKLVEVMPNNGRAWSGLGTAEMLNLNLDAALAAFHKTRELLPEFVGNWNVMGWCYLRQQNITEAKRCFEHAMTVDRNFAENHGSLAVIALAENDPISAERYIQVALRLNSQCFSARYANALLLNRTDPERAKEAMNTLTQEMPLTNTLLRQCVADYLENHK